MSALVRYDAARNALQQAVEIDEVKDIRDKAEAMAAYARQAKDTEMIQWVTEIKVRAERRAGQMLADMPKSEGTKGQLHGKYSGGHIVVPPEESTKTLSEMGITKNESSRWQKLAAVDEDKFEKAVTAAKEVAGEVTTAAMLRIARADKDAHPVERTGTKSKPEQNQPENTDYYDPHDPETRIKELSHALEDTAKEASNLTALVKSLEATDGASEMAKLHERILGLEGRLSQETTTKNEAIKTVKHYKKLLDSIMAKVGVHKHGDILGALK